MPLYNGSLECELREYIIFDGDYKSFRKSGGSIRKQADSPESQAKKRPLHRGSDQQWRDEARRSGFGGKKATAATFDKSPRRPKPTGWKAGGRPQGEESARQESENPLASRRNEQALKMLIGKAPSLPKSDQPMMRPRRGWKKGGESTEE